MHFFFLKSLNILFLSSWIITNIQDVNSLSITFSYTDRDEEIETQSKKSNLRSQRQWLYDQNRILLISILLLYSVAFHNSRAAATLLIAQAHTIPIKFYVAAAPWSCAKQQACKAITYLKWK